MLARRCRDPVGARSPNLVAQTKNLLGSIASQRLGRCSPIKEARQCAAQLLGKDGARRCLELQQVAQYERRASLTRRPTRAALDEPTRKRMQAAPVFGKNTDQRALR